MIPELFILCALSLPGTHYRTEMTDEDRGKIEDIRRLRDFIERTHPGAKIVIVPKDISDAGIMDKDMERLPFTWGGKSIYIRRQPVYDRRIKGAA